LRTLPWLATEEEARSGVEGFTRVRRLLAAPVVGDLGGRVLRLDSLRCPVTLAQGTADMLAGGQTSRYPLVVPEARFAPLPGADHSPLSDTPATILQLVNETVRRAD
jgi:pimeloyl-ACP methyl ester carboxylesterase